MYAFLLDRTSGTGDIDSALERVIEECTKKGLIGVNYALSDESRAIKEIESFISQIDDEHNTVIVVGDDWTLTQTINTVAKHDTDIAVGYIPITTESRYANLIGVETWKEAIGILKKRLLKPVPLLSINSEYFLDRIKLKINSTSTDKLPSLKIETNDLEIKSNTTFGLIISNTQIDDKPSPSNIKITGFTSTDTKETGVGLVKRLSTSPVPSKDNLHLQYYCDNLVTTLRNANFELDSQELSLKKLSIGSTEKVIDLIVGY